MTHIFAYGTLMYPELLQQLTGRQWQLESAKLTQFSRHILMAPGFSQSPVIVPNPEGEVVGKIMYNVDAATLALLDAYECVDDGVYQRVSAVAQLHGSEKPLAVDCYCLGSNRIPYAGEWQAAAFEADHYQTFKHQIIPEFLQEYYAND